MINLEGLSVPFLATVAALVAAAVLLFAVAAWYDWRAK